MNAATIEAPGADAPAPDPFDRLDRLHRFDTPDACDPHGDDDASATHAVDGDGPGDGEAPDVTGTGARRGAARTPDASDAELAGWISAVVDRDERALAALYDATFARVYGLALRIVRRAALAEEVTEDTFFQVWRQAPRFDPARGSAMAWLLAMARSRAIDALRHESRFAHDPLDESAEQGADDAVPAADDLLDLARHRADLQQALLRLGAQPRQLVSLAFFRGLSHEEIAQHAGLPLGTVKSQIRRALIALRQILGDAGPLLAS